jgi:adenylate cyclase
MFTESINDYLSNPVWQTVTAITLIIFVLFLLLKIFLYIFDKKHTSIINSLNGRISPETIRELKEHPEKLQLSRSVGVKNKALLSSPYRDITVLHFTPRQHGFFSETLMPDELSDLFKFYLTKMTQIIFDQGGTILQYNDLALTAFWGAPLSCDDAPKKACEAALLILSRTKGLDTELKSRWMLQPFQPIISITTEELLVGDFGSEQKPFYAIYGDYEYKLKGLMKLSLEYNTNILITQSTHKHVKNNFIFNPVDKQLRTKGFTNLIAVYELCGNVMKYNDLINPAK